MLLQIATFFLFFSRSFFQYHFTSFAIFLICAYLLPDYFYRYYVTNAIIISSGLIASIPGILPQLPVTMPQRW